jgi:hypothetical protein
MTNPTEPNPIAALVERFPRLFHGQPPRVASWAPAGWMPLVTTLLEDLDAMLDASEAKRFHIEQIKEKFGGLRVYWSLGPEKTTVMDVSDAQSSQRLECLPKRPSPVFERITARISEAEARAARTCQRCGCAGASKGSERGWLSTLCERCRSTTPEPKAS